MMMTPVRHLLLTCRPHLQEQDEAVASRPRDVLKALERSERLLLLLLLFLPAKVSRATVDDWSILPARQRDRLSPVRQAEY